MIARVGWRRWEATEQIAPGIHVVGRGRSRRGAQRDLARRLPAHRRRASFDPLPEVELRRGIAADRQRSTHDADPNSYHLQMPAWIRVCPWCETRLR